MSPFLNRLPRINQLYPVYGVIVTLIYGWSLYQFFYILPSRLKFLTYGEIGLLLAYTLVNNLLESFLILALLAMFAIILPGKLLLDEFAFRGSFSALYILILFIVVSYNDLPLGQISELWIWALVGFVVLHIIVGKIVLARNIIEKFADSTVVFLYLSIPLSLLSLSFVLVRNI